MAELVRGSFIFCMCLGALSIIGALTGLAFSDLGKAGKLAELLFLFIVLMFIHREHSCHWRSQWLAVREIERCLDQAGWLTLLGRTRAYHAPAYLKDIRMDAVSRWCASYLQAVLRHASFPCVKLDKDYLGTSHTLILENLVKDQIEYYADESELNCDGFPSRRRLPRGVQNFGDDEVVLKRRKPAWLELPAHHRCEVRERIVLWRGDGRRR